MLKKSFWLGVCFVAAPAYAQTPADSLSLDEVVARALQHSPEIVQAENTVSNARSAERVAFGNYLPSLALTTNYGLASSDRVDTETNALVSGSSDSYRAGLNLGLDVYTGGRRGAENRRTNAITEAAQATLVERKYAVTLAAKRAYFDVAKAGELVTVAQARLARANDGQVAA